MKVQNSEVIIPEIIEQLNLSPTEPLQQKVLVEWRSRLAKEPYLLQPFQIDQIVRDVRSKLVNASKQPSISLQAAPTFAPSTIVR